MDPAQRTVQAIRSLEDQEAAFNLKLFKQAGRVASGDLGEADVTTLQDMLARADAIRASVAQLLAKHGQPVEANALPLGNTAAPLPTGDGVHESKRRCSNDSAMQLD